MEFGAWDGLTFGEVRERFPDEVQRWLGSLDVAPGGGESFREVEARVLAGLDRVLERYAGRTVLVVSHVTPIKTLVADAARRAAVGAVPDGALARVGQRGPFVACRATTTATPAAGGAARCACSTPSRPARDRCSTRSAGSEPHAAGLRLRPR